jgi:hypothetical protein
VASGRGRGCWHLAAGRRYRGGNHFRWRHAEELEADANAFWCGRLHDSCGVVGTTLIGHLGSKELSSVTNVSGKLDQPGLRRIACRIWSNVLNISRGLLMEFPLELEAVEGAKDLREWFGFWPSFHDAEVISLHQNRSATSSLLLHTWEMAKETDERGYYVLTKHVVVEFLLEEILDLSLKGFSQ